MQQSRYRVIQWATGAVGTHALRALIEDPLFELVGLYVHHPAKVGTDAGQLAGLPVRTGIVATNDATALLATAADCAVYTAVGETRPREAVAEIAALLIQGLSIKDAAASLGVSMTTARTFVSQIIAKTDSHSQAELMLRLLAIPRTHSTT